MIINFVRCRRVAQVVTDLLQHQQSPYNLRLCRDVREYVLYLKAGVPDELYTQSLLLEPRNSGTLDAEGNLIRAPANSDVSRSHTICRAHYLHRVAAMKAEVVPYRVPYASGIREM
ncbi:hypothetical protein SARC_09156 [Sphaeroforma arctica JP610]|uniref:Uncharacterized protein n=1 Tax=Sphaeroforma arctica JP610 TaxID=667725 RepID=A0A0L0FNK8_9EUKA|nr:hypothetical protein SARC_09156 [Sphaeroforma arctica JP610]KNC78410.1 hypothetical protein SARC_09156 [Sphaeroforma arctica JP610]|eukprot:XP_014152312.1 hypothetical protein SARC_09156 [Sphaeroforma arctica JP610]